MIQSKGQVHGVGVRTVAERSGRKRDIQSRLKQAEDAKKKERSRAVRYRRDLKQAGLSITLRQFFVVCGFVAVIAAALYLAMDYPPVGALPVAVSVGFGLPRFVVRWLGKRRVKKFTLLFANAVDVIVRGIRSGLPVGECLGIIARESPEPVAGVFREIVEAQRLGLSLEQALERAEELMPTSEVKFFNIVLGIQQQTGGNLAETLSNLSSILRARKKMSDKVKALSSEARSSAMIIGSLPFLMTGLLWLVSPEYIALLFSADIGKIMIMAGLAWMAIGVFVMKQMVSFEI
jgi:tight adherence protein B